MFASLFFFSLILDFYGENKTKSQVCTLCYVYVFVRSTNKNGLAKYLDRIIQKETLLLQ